MHVQAAWFFLHEHEGTWLSHRLIAELAGHDQLRTLPDDNGWMNAGHTERIPRRPNPLGNTMEIITELVERQLLIPKMLGWPEHEFLCGQPREDALHYFIAPRGCWTAEIAAERLAG